MKPRLSIGSWFHCLQATSHALQPMQSVVSVRKPHRARPRAGRPDLRFVDEVDRCAHLVSGSKFPDVAGERLGLVDERVRIFDQGGEVVGDGAGGDAAEAEVPRHADLVDGAGRRSAAGAGGSVTSARVSISPRRVAIATQSPLCDAELGGKLGADLGEAFRLQLGQPGDPAAHAARRVVLGQAIGRDDVGKARIAKLVVAVVGRAKMMARPGCGLVRDRAGCRRAIPTARSGSAAAHL